MVKRKRIVRGPKLKISKCKKFKKDLPRLEREVIRNPFMTKAEKHKVVKRLRGCSK